MPSDHQTQLWRRHNVLSQCLGGAPCVFDATKGTQRPAGLPPPRCLPPAWWSPAPLWKTKPRFHGGDNALRRSGTASHLTLSGTAILQVEWPTPESFLKF